MLPELLLGLALAAPDAPVVYLPEAPTSLDPLFGFTPTDRLVHSLLHRRLFTVGPDGAWASELVASWSQEGTSARLELVRGQRWHDGAPIGAVDVCFTLDALLHGHTLSPLGPRTRAQVATCRVDPDAPRVAHLTLHDDREGREALAFPLAPAHAYASTAVSGDPRTQVHAIGAGPYRLEGRGPAGYHLVAHEPDLPFDALVLAPVDGAWVGAQAFARSDEAVATAWVPVGALPALREAPDRGLYPFDRWVAWSLALDLEAPPLDDPRVREALDLLIDREGLRRHLAGGDDPTRDEAPWPLVSGPYRVGSGRGSRGVPVPLRDPARAAALLEAAGFTLGADGRWLQPDGSPFTLRVVAPTGHGVSAPDLARALGLDGLGVQVERVQRPAWVASVLAGGQKGAADAALVPRELYPTDDPGPWFHRRTAHDGWANVFDIHDDAIDALVVAARTDPEAARRLHGRLADQRSHLFLFEERQWTAWRGPFTTWMPAPYDGWSAIGRWRR